MITKLAEWYRVAKISAYTVEILESRSKAITSIIETKEIDWLFDSLRLYLNKSISNQEFKNEFIRLFSEDDKLFPQRDNELELRILAGALINEYIAKDEFDDCISVALALISASYHQENIINSDIIDNAKEYLNRKSIELRDKSSDFDLINNSDEEEEEEEEEEETIESLNIKFENFKTNSYNISQINDLFKKLNSRLNKLEEESNIHWWIFRGYSNFNDKPIKELELQIAPIVLAFDLSELTMIIPAPPSSIQFLKKVLNENISEIKKPIELREIINKLEKNAKEKLVHKYQNTKLGNICPFMYGVLKAIEADDDKSWFTFFEKHTNIKCNLKVDNIDIAYQFYLECLLVKSLV